MRRWIPFVALVAVLATGANLCAASAAKPADDWPDTSAGRLARGWVEANGWNSGGYGFCNGFGTTPTAVRMPSLTPLPYFSVVSSVQGVGPAGIFQNFPS